MYLIDTNVLSEVRKKKKANKGVRKFIESAINHDEKLYVSVITIGELRRGVELIRYRGDVRQANLLERWLELVLTEYKDYVLSFDEATAQLWGALRAPNHEHATDKQIAATAVIYGLTVVTRNVKDFAKTGAKVLNPFLD